MAAMFVRPCRSATIRTRLDVDAVRSYLSVLAEEGSPEGVDRLLAHGFFLAGAAVGERDFHFDYRFNSSKNPQTYAVRGTIRDERDWRILRLKLTAHDPWLGPLEAIFLAIFIAFYVFTGEMPPKAAIGIFFGLTGLYAIANLLYIPAVVTARASALLASQVRGSILTGDDWVVPR